LDPLFISGFVDAEGCFSVSLVENSSYTSGYQVYLSFSIGLNKKDLVLLKSIQAYFGGIGSITNAGKDSIQYKVTFIDDLKVIILHFDNYSLITQKQADVLLFKQAFDLIARKKKHLTSDGLMKIASIKASMNLGLSERLSNSFKVIPVDRPIVSNQKIPSPF
jgi:hypothetical protein